MASKLKLKEEFTNEMKKLEGKIDKNTKESVRIEKSIKINRYVDKEIIIYAKNEPDTDWGSEIEKTNFEKINYVTLLRRIDWTLIDYSQIDTSVEQITRIIVDSYNHTISRSLSAIDLYLPPLRKGLGKFNSEPLSVD